MQIYASYSSTYNDEMMDDYMYLPADLFHVKLMNVQGNFKDTLTHRYSYLYDRTSVPKGKEETYRKSLNNTQLEILSDKNKAKMSKLIDEKFKAVDKRADDKFNERLNDIIAKKEVKNGR